MRTYRSIIAAQKRVKMEAEAARFARIGVLGSAQVLLFLPSISFLHGTMGNTTGNGNESVIHDRSTLACACHDRCVRVVLVKFLEPVCWRFVLM